jgi:hypothetical protein
MENSAEINNKLNSNITDNKDSKYTLNSNITNNKDDKYINIDLESDINNDHKKPGNCCCCIC